MAIGLLFIVAAVLLVALAVVLIRVWYKKRLNRRLADDRETLASGGVPSNAGRHEISGWGAVALVLASVAFVFSVGVFATSLANSIENRISGVDTNTNNKINQILSRIDEMKREQKKAQSMLSSFSVIQPAENYWNEDQMTVRYEVVIVPKETSADTEVSLTLGGVTYETERDGTAFSAFVDVPLFLQEADGNEVCVSVISGGVSQNEVLTEEDTSVFQTLGNLFFADWGSVFPHFEEMTTVVGHRTVPELKKGCFSIDWWLDARLKAGINGVSKCSVALYDGNRVLLELDLTDLLEPADEFYYDVQQFKLEGSWKDIGSDFVDMVFTVTDNRGYTVTSHERYYDANVSAFDRYETTLTAPDGTVRRMY